MRFAESLASVLLGVATVTLLLWPVFMPSGSDEKAKRPAQSIRPSISTDPARAALRRLVRARAVVCDLPDAGEQKSFTARCAVSGTDLSTWMVRHGWAKPNDPPEPVLAEAARAAKAERIGFWRGAE